MGKGQSKQRKKVIDSLECKDWIMVEKQDPDALKPLPYWIKQYGFNGKLSTAGIKDLQQKIRNKTNCKEKQMNKEGIQHTFVWMKIAGQREAGEKRARQAKIDKKEQERQQQERDKKQEQECREQDKTTTLFHRKEDDEYVGPYREAREMLDRRSPKEEGNKPPVYSPPSAAMLHPTAPDAPYTRSQGTVGDWTKKMVTGRENMFSPETSRLPENTPPPEDLCPLIELPNPRAGQKGEDLTIRVFRTWTKDDIKKALEGIPSPKEDIAECVTQMENIRQSYHLNGTEVQQVWMTLLGPDWFHVKGGYTPADDDGRPFAPHSMALRLQLEPLIERVITRFRKRANYTEIGRCKQKPDESFEDYRTRLEKVFRANSGLPYNDEETGPYKQQLKNALHAGTKTEISQWVAKHYINLPSGNLEEYITHATHAEKVTKNKQKKEAQDTFHIGESEVYYQKSTNRGRGRGQYRGRGGRGRNGGRGRLPYFGRPNVCWTCGKPGHFSRECTRTHSTSPNESMSA
uniref:uncharacterized protein LOC131129998 isoform X2 n=1 Tax=Doryrhamphus excisus TaxID=161450 RepID=UPI0025AE2661|nr:uncharacterized protein LOC131129998 isoform X2 [Doryrhamphus excisus]